MRDFDRPDLEVFANDFCRRFVVVETVWPCTFSSHHVLNLAHPKDGLRFRDAHGRNGIDDDWLGDWTLEPHGIQSVAKLVVDNESEVADSQKMQAWETDSPGWHFALKPNATRAAPLPPRLVLVESAVCLGSVQLALHWDISPPSPASLRFVLPEDCQFQSIHVNNVPADARRSSKHQWTVALPPTRQVVRVSLQANVPGRLANRTVGLPYLEGQNAFQTLYRVQTIADWCVQLDAMAIDADDGDHRAQQMAKKNAGRTADTLAELIPDSPRSVQSYVSRSVVPQIKIVRPWRIVSVQVSRMSWLLILFGLLTLLILQTPRSWPALPRYWPVALFAFGSAWQYWGQPFWIGPTLTLIASGICGFLCIRWLGPLFLMRPKAAIDGGPGQRDEA